MANVAPSPGRLTVFDIITQVAKEYGIPPLLALSIAAHESGFNTKAVGDNGTSFGLFQLHQGGELGNHSQAWAENPYNNARTALAEVARVYHANPNLDFGTIAAKAQRPADAAAYALDINDTVKRARGHQAGATQYFSQYLNGTVPQTYAANRVTTTGGVAANGGHPLGYNTVTTQQNGGAGNGGVSVTINQPGSTSAGDVPHLTQQDFQAGISEAGFSMGLIKSNRELRTIFNQAIKGGWFTSQSGINRFLNAVQNSHWYRSRDDAQRKFDNLQYSNPAELQRQIAATQSSLGTLSQQLGIQLSPEQAAKLAHTAVRNGLTDQEIRDSVVGFYHFDPHQELTGQAGADVSSIKQVADSYYVPVTDSVLDSLSRKMLDGTLDQNALQAYFQQQAFSRFPHLQKQIEQGLTVADIADPYKKMMADTLEQDPNGIKNTDPTIMKALQAPDGKGGFQLMPLWQYQQTLRQDPRWMQTNNARDSLMDMGSGLLRSMGLVA